MAIRSVKAVTVTALIALVLWHPLLSAQGAPSSHWWQGAVIYEIYPRSFQDSNGDGIGDLSGITRRLDYLQSLGVDAIWITPMFPSPLVDFGYNVSDYEGIAPEYGTMADFDDLLSRAHQHHIRVILDLVLNHTSDKHPWFVEASRSVTDRLHDGTSGIQENYRGTEPGFPQINGAVTLADPHGNGKSRSGSFTITPTIKSSRT